MARNEKLYNDGQNGGLATLDVRPGHGARDAWLWLAALSAAIAYGTLLPFDLGGRSPWGLLSASISAAPFSLAWIVPSISDLVTNVALYLPLGVVIGWNVGGGRKTAVLRAAIFGAMLSLCLESIQAQMPLRYASWIDVLLNTAGAGMGAVFAGLLRRLVHRTASSFARRPFTLLTGVVLVSLVFLHVSPWSPVSTDAGLHEGFRNALWPAFTNGAAVWPIDGEPVGQVLMFFALGYLLYFAARESGWTGAQAFDVGVVHGLSIVLVILVLDVLTVRGRIDLVLAGQRSMAVLVGAFLAAYLAARQSETAAVPLKGHGLTEVIPTRWLAVAAAMQVGAWWLETPGTWMVSRGSAIIWERACWLPYHALWVGPMDVAARTVIGDLLGAGALGAVLYVALRRTGCRRAWQMSAILTTLAAACATPVDAPDPTRAVTALAAVILLAAMTRRSMPVLSGYASAMGDPVALN